MKINKKNIVKLNLISVGGSSTTRFSKSKTTGFAPEIPMTIAVMSALGWMGHDGFRIGNGVRFLRGLK
jgi:hypothetical protein